MQTLGQFFDPLYDMLLFALTYRDALDAITADRDFKLRQFEMDDEEWDIARQLCQVLKASYNAN